jgi:hypothetical protein
VEDIEKRADLFNRIVFSILKVLFPCPDNKPTNTSFDNDPPGAFVSILINSKTLDKAAELLRNDSLDNATKRKDLYKALICFLRVTGTHEATKDKAVYSERTVWPGNINLLTLSFHGSGSIQSEAGSSLAAGLRNLNIQREVMLKSALGARKEFTDQQGKDILWLCRMISDLCSHLGIKGDDAQRGLTTHGIVEVPDDEIWQCYFFSSDARNVTQARAGRIKRLITEAATPKTGLAEGIFVKHAMSRLDVMK